MIEMQHLYLITIHLGHHAGAQSALPEVGQLLWTFGLWLEKLLATLLNSLLLLQRTCFLYCSWEILITVMPILSHTPITVIGVSGV